MAVALQDGNSRFEAMYPQLVELGRISGSTESSVNFVCSILGIKQQQLDDCHAPLLSSRSQISSVHGEYILRWLLPKISVPGDEGVPARSNATLWQLLAYLLRLLPLATSARILRAHNVIHIACDALHELAETFKRLDFSQRSDEGDGVRSDSTVDAGASTTSHVASSRKRKRGSPSSSSERDASPLQNGAVTYRWILHTLEAIYSVSALHSNHDALQMRSMQRPDLLSATTFLGDALYIAQALLQPSSPLLQYEPWFQHFRIVLDYWDRWNVLLFASSTKTVNQHFVSHCLLPCLSCLKLLKDHKYPARRFSQYADYLEDLLDIHVHIPAYKQYNSLHDQLPSHRKHEAFEQAFALFYSAFQWASEQSRATQESSQVLSLTPLLFKLSMESSAPIQPSKRLVTKHWREALFWFLLECSGYSIRPSSPSNRVTDDSTTLLDMLDVAIEKGVSLDANNVRHILSTYGGLSDTSSGGVDYHLIVKVLRLDPNILLLPGGRPEPSTQSERFLFDTAPALFRHIGHSYKDFGNPGKRLLLQDIVVPLVHAYAQARNLSLFVENWRQQLEELEVERSSSGSDSLELSIWEHEDVFSAIGSVLESSLTSEQIETLMNTTIDGLDLSALLPIFAGRAQAKAFANLVILEAVCRSIKDLYVAEDLQPPIYYAWTQLILQITGQRWRSVLTWRLWRALAACHEPLLADQVLCSLAEYRHESGHDEVDLRFASAVKIGHQQALGSITQRSNSRQDQVSSLAMFEAICAAPDFRTWLNRGKEALQSATEEILRTMTELHRPNETRAQPITGVDSTNSPQTSDNLRLFQAGLTNLILKQRSPCIMTADQDTRRQFLRVAMSQTVDGMLSKGCHTPFFRSIWNSLFSDVFLDEFDYKEDLVLALIEQINRPELISDAEPIHARQLLLVDGFLSLSISGLTQSEREQLLDFYLQAIETAKDVSLDFITKSLSLMSQLVRLPVTSSKLATDHLALWRLADKLDAFLLKSSESTEAALCSMYKQLAQSTLRYRFEAILQNSKQPFLRKLLKTLESRLRLGPPLFGERNQVKLRLIEVVLTGCFKYETWLKDDIPLLLGRIEEQMDDAMKTISRVDQVSSTKIDVRSEAHSNMSKNTLLLAQMSLLLGTMEPSRIERFYPEFRDTLKRMAKRIISGANTNSATRGFVKDEISSVITAFQVFSAIGERLIDWGYREFGALLDSELDDLQSAHVQEVFKNSMTQLGLRDKIDVLHFCFKFKLESGQATENALVALQSLLTSVPKERASKGALSFAYPHLCRMMETVRSIPAFNLICNCIDTLLVSQPAWAAQHILETTVSTFTVLISFYPSTDEEQQMYCARYSRFCKLFQTILKTHRLRLQGRFHLILQLLDAFMDGLYYCSSPQASSLAGVLTTLCDPTTLSVTAGSEQKRGRALTPATDKAARLAGQYLPSFLFTYFDCSLRFSKRVLEVEKAAPLDQATKAALMPGLFAILDITPRETILQQMNSAMNAEDRALFKDLWDEYNRRGQSSR